MNKQIAERRGWKLQYRIHVGAQTQGHFIKHDFLPGTGETFLKTIPRSILNQRNCEHSCHKDGTKDGPSDRTFACKECYGTDHVPIYRKDGHITYGNETQRL